MEKLLIPFETLESQYKLPSQLKDDDNNKDELNIKNILLQHNRFNNYEIMCIDIGLGWKKLAQYYTLTDQPPVHVLAVIPHPHLTIVNIREALKSRPNWITAAEKVARSYWLNQYTQTAVIREVSITYDYDDDFNDDDTISTLASHEYSQWLLRS